jgi:hypothetical protein
VTEPTTQTLLDALKALVEPLDTAAVVLDYWPAAFLRAGASLNFGRGEAGTVKAWAFSLFAEENERVGDVPEDPARCEGKAYTRKCEWLFRWKYVRSWFEGVDADGKRSEQLFDEELQAAKDALGLSPKLGASRRVERHYELQITGRTIPSYGQELAHTGEGVLKVSLRQIVKP